MSVLFKVLQRNRTNKMWIIDSYFKELAYVMDLTLGVGGRWGVECVWKIHTDRLETKGQIGIVVLVPKADW